MFTETKQVSQRNETEECCPFFEPSKWDNVQHEWKDKLFLKDSVPEFLHIPLPGSYRKVITRMWKKAERASAIPKHEDFLIIAHDPSAFKGELYMLITKEVPGEENVKLSGSFYSKVFEAGYHEVPKCLRKMDEFLTSNALVALKHYVSFPYCPKCSEKYGHKYVMVITKVEAL